MPAYKTLKREGSAEVVITKSRFIGQCRPCHTEEEALAFLDAVQAGDHALVLDAQVDVNVDCASRNLPTVLVMPATSVNPYLMLRFKKVVITKAGLDALGERLGQ